MCPYFGKIARYTWRKTAIFEEHQSPVAFGP